MTNKPYEFTRQEYVDKTNPDNHHDAVLYEASFDQCNVAIKVIFRKADETKIKICLSDVKPCKVIRGSVAGCDITIYNTRSSFIPKELVIEYKLQPSKLLATFEDGKSVYKPHIEGVRYNRSKTKTAIEGTIIMQPEMYNK